MSAFSSTAGTAPAHFSHPRGLWFLAFAEAWERFSFYGMQTLLVLYMVSRLLLPGHIEHVDGYPILKAGLQAVFGSMSVQAQASAVFGLYGGLVYLTPIFGGLLADRVLGRRRTVIIGALLMATGHFLMAFEQPFLLALLCLVLGNGCFKGNIASQVGGLYAPDDQHRADAFQIFYLAINGGVIAAPLVCGTLGEVFGWHWGFGAAGVGTLIGLSIYLSGQRHLPPEQVRTRGAPVPNPGLTGRERAVIALLIALLPVLAVGLVGNQEIFNAYLVWAKANANLTVVGRTLPTTWLITLDTIASVSCLVGSVAFWRLWSRWRPEPDELSKITLGSLISVGGLLTLAGAAAYSAATGQKVGLCWLVAFHILNSVGFANILPVSLALYSRLAPRRSARPLLGFITCSCSPPTC